ncbi:MAG: PAS domain-containing sensor histidine kinase [Bacteroidetes bacterium]|nr:PAS domain-containing sensor histidine kinase [Bacteroidota bacterium]
MPLKSIRPFSLFGRTLLLLISVILIPLVIFTYLFYLLYYGLIQLNNLYLHFAFIISLSFITILIAAYESTVNIRLGLKLTVKTLEKMRKHESDVNLPMISKDEIGIISQYINILAAALRNHTKKNNELTKNLEHKVQERTKKLHENTIELTSVNTSLKEAEEKSRLLLENSPDYIIYMDKEYNIQYFNRVPSGVFIENKGSLFDIIIPEYRENIITAINNVFTTGQKQLTESKILLQNDTPIWFENRFVAIKNDDLVNGAMIIATDITQKKESQARLEEMQKAAVKNAHIAGMANIAIDVLHNVGNVLNSIMTSGQIALDTLKNSQANRLIKANELLLENKDKMEDFILNDPKGKKLLDYYFLIGDKIIDGNTLLTNHLHRILEKAKVINDIIIAQQVIVPFKSITETLNISELLDEAIKLHENDLNQFHIHFNKKYENVPQVCVQRVKLTFIFMSLLKNAKEAMLEMPMDKRVIDLSIQKVNHSVQVKISDTGCGIGHEFLEKVFFYGFTTKQKGLGFALHSCANYMAEMGGKIRVQSSGVGKGAIFILSFPLQTVDI